MDIEKMQLANLARIVTGESIVGEPLDFLISKLNCCHPDTRKKYLTKLKDKINISEYPETLRELISEMQDCLGEVIVNG